VPAGKLTQPLCMLIGLTCARALVPVPTRARITSAHQTRMSRPIESSVLCIVPESDPAAAGSRAGGGLLGMLTRETPQATGYLPGDVCECRSGRFTPPLLPATVPLLHAHWKLKLPIRTMPVPLAPGTRGFRCGCLTAPGF
jgi:hypothetical protein